MFFSRSNLSIIFKEFIIRAITFDYFILKKIIHREVPQKAGIKVLDMGCGTGILSPLFSESHYIGIDIDKKLIDFAQKKYPYAFKVMSGEKILFPKNSFDLIIVIGVIHHLNDKATNKTLAEMKKVLKKDGRVLLVEAIPPIDNYNYVGHFIRSLDEGHNIRKLEEYGKIFKKYFTIQKKYKNRGGIVDYGVFVLTR